jgi:WD40 repeat protein
VNRVRFSPEGKLFAASTGNWQTRAAGEVTLWVIPSDESVGALRGHSREVAGLAFAPDGKTLASASADGKIKLWDLETNRERGSWTHGDCKTIAFAPDGKTLVSGHYGGDVVLWDVASGRPRALLGGVKELAFAVAFAPDGRTIAAAGKDGKVRLWNVPVRVHQK